MDFFHGRLLPALQHLTLLWDSYDDGASEPGQGGMLKFLEQVAPNLRSLEVDDAFAYYVSDKNQDCNFRL